MTIVNDGTSWIVTLESSIVLLESSIIMFSENIYSTGACTIKLFTDVIYKFSY